MDSYIKAESKKLGGDKVGGRVGWGSTAGYAAGGILGRHGDVTRIVYALRYAPDRIPRPRFEPVTIWRLKCGGVTGRI